MSEELKRCPFCGGEAEVKADEAGLEYVSCPACGTHTLWSVNACSAWNKRRRAGIELKPCPFCGSRAKLHEAYDGKYCVQCKDCGITSSYERYPEDARKTWNARCCNE